MITDISSAPEIFTLLADEIHAEGEYLSFRINLIDVGAGSTTDVEGNENVLAQGSVALWVMIEDSCSILRQVRGDNFQLHICNSPFILCALERKKTW